MAPGTGDSVTTAGPGLSGRGVRSAGGFRLAHKTRTQCAASFVTACSRLLAKPRLEELIAEYLQYPDGFRYPVVIIRVTARSGTAGGQASLISTCN
jgi:hypothetical protein